MSSVDRYDTLSLGPRSVRLSCPIVCNQAVEFPLVSGGGSRWEYKCDILLYGDNVCFISDHVPLSSVLGIGSFTDNSLDPSYLLKGDKPINTDYDSGYDWSCYGSIFNVPNAIRPHDDIGYFERNVRHSHYRGWVRDRSSSDLYSFTGDGLTLNGYFLNRWTPTHPEYGALDTAEGVGFTDTGFIQFGLLDTQIGPHPSYEYLEWIQWTTDRVNGPGLSFSPGAFWLLEWSNMTNNSRREGNNLLVNCSYDYDIRYAGVAHAKFRVNVNGVVSYVPVFGSNPLFQWNPISPGCVQIYNDSSVHLLEWEDLLDRPEPLIEVPFRLSFVDDADRNICIFDSGYQSSPGSTSNLESFRRKTVGGDFNRHHREFERYVRDRFSDFQASSFYAASDALDKSIGILKANHLENLSQLGGILELLPDLPGLAALAAKATRGDPGVVVDIIDYITAAWLKLKFGQKPTIDDAYELAKSDFSEKLEGILSKQQFTGYGFFKWVKPDDVPFFGPGRLEVVTRTKIRFVIDSTSLLASYVAGNAAGLLPTLSRVWDLVPFSFVVDWFANIGGRLKQVDNQLLWMGIGVDYALYSYQITYYPTSLELEAYGLESPDEDNPFGITLYVREKSLCVPRLRDSKFDYLAPSRPNLVTLGSFLWQTVQKL